MNLTQLHYFQVVAEQQSFTKAARLLYVTQPTLSRQIVELEEEYGVPLFIRTKPNLTLTRAGAFFLQGAQDILKRCHQLDQQMKTLQFSSAFSLAIGYLTYMDHHLLHEPLKALLGDVPDLSYTLQNYTPKALSEALENGNIDLAFTFAMLVPDNPAWDCQTVAENPCLIAVPRDHALAKKEVLDWKDLIDEPLILFDRSLSPKTVDYLVAACLQHGVTPKIEEKVSDLTSLLLFVSMGRGLAFLSAGCCRPEANPDIAYIPLASDQHPNPFNMVIAYPKQTENPLISQFIEKVSAMTLLHDQNRDLAAQEDVVADATQEDFL